MNLKLRALLAARALCRASMARIDAALAPPEKPEPDIDPELAERMRRDLERKMRRAGTRPWNYSRRDETRIPQSLLHYEAIHGTKATLELLRRKSTRDR